MKHFICHTDYYDYAGNILRDEEYDAYFKTFPDDKVTLDRAAQPPVGCSTSESPRYADQESYVEDADNRGRRMSLEDNLRQGHYAWFPIKGYYGGKENSYMIYNTTGGRFISG